MIKIYASPPAFGLPNPSPFVVKAFVLFKMANIPYELAQMDFKQAPKGKIPYIEDNGKLLGDSTLIKFHLEEKYNADFDNGYSKEELAIGWAFEKMCEEHLYWIEVKDRWLIDENFDKGPRTFFDPVPAILRPLIINSMRKKIRTNLFAHGLGRHSDSELLKLGKRDIDALSAQLGDKLFLLGEEPCGYDASVYGIVQSAASPFFNSEIGEYIRSKFNISAYIKRIRELYFPT